MKEIPLTQGRITLVDDEDYDYLNQWKWYAHYEPKNGSFYAIRNEGKRPNRTTIPMHRAILREFSSRNVDHINHDTLDNQKENLRSCNVRQNQYNRRVQKNNSSGYKGVYLHKGRWTVQIKTDEGKLYRYFDNKEDAAREYDILAKIHHGEFACLNFPESE